jgi:arylsulfatase A-like enzyme
MASRRVRAGWLLVPLLAAVVCASSCRDSSAPEGKPGHNVLLIVVDTLRADHMSHYGHDLETSVGLDRFAVQANRFVRAYSVSPLTPPSTASILTGLAPETHGVKGTGQRLPAQAVTLAERLQRDGWRTAGFSHNVVIGEVTGFAQGFDEFVDYRGRLRAYPDVSAMVNAAILWILRADRPFFLYLHPMNVHGPYKVPEVRASDLLGRPPVEGFQFYGPVMSKLMDEGQLAMREQVSEEMLTSLQEQYDTAIRYTCDQIARVIDALRARDLYDDTLVMIAADHGEELFEHGGFGHGYTLYREVLQVPLLVKLPGQSTSRTIEAPVSLLDVYPTILDALGLELPEGLHGRSLLPVLRGEAQADEERILYFHEDGHRMTGRALLTRDYKLIEIDRDYEKRRSVWQLLDAEEDPLELTDLAGARPEVVAELAPQLEASSQRYRSQSPGDAESVRDQLDEDLLRSLGYVE